MSRQCEGDWWRNPKRYLHAGHEIRHFGRLLVADDRRGELVIMIAFCNLVSQFCIRDRMLENQIDERANEG